ncbi:MAG: hypothetical protein QF828_16500, partial [Pseudomonadales bacterium]|nr:hypothetical protein [Pseudomonadales bacterium]
AVALRTARGEEVDAPSGETVISKQDSVVMLVRTRQNGREAGAPRQMGSMAWSDEMLVGNALIDQQHRSLVMLAHCCPNV